MDLIISAIVGGIVGLLIAVLFQDPLNNAKNRLNKQIRIALHRSPKLLPQPRTFSLGQRQTLWLVVDGDGYMTYEPETIKCIVDTTPTPLPLEIEQFRARIEELQTDRKKKGLPFQWNGPKYALYRYAISRTIPDEYMEVTFTLRPTDYYTFQATVASLDKNLMGSSPPVTLRQKYLHGLDLEALSEPIPFLANGFGVTLIVITKDRKLIFSYRSTDTGIRAGELDVSVVEGIHPTLDRSTFHHGPDLYRTAIRGAQEELGLELLQNDITFLGFGVDLEYYQWNVIGIARCPEKAQELLERRGRGVGGKWEIKKFEFVDSNPRTVFQLLKDRKMWSMGLVTVYWGLVHEYGRKRVNAAAESIFK